MVAFPSSPNAGDGVAVNGTTVAVDGTVIRVSGSHFTGGITVVGTGSFEGGISGSLTRLTTGISYMVGGGAVSITTQSNGQVLVSGSGITSVQPGDGINVFGAQPTVGVDGSVARVSGSHFTGGITVVGTGTFEGGISGSLTRLASGLSYLTSAGPVNVVTQSNGQVLISGSGIQSISQGDGVSIGAGSSPQVNVDGTVARISGSHFSGGITVVGTGSFESGLSGSLTTLVGGQSYLAAGSNISVSSASNGQVTIAATIPPWTGSAQYLFLCGDGSDGSFVSGGLAPNYVNLWTTVTITASLTPSAVAVGNALVVRHTGLLVVNTGQSINVNGTGAQGGAFGAGGVSGSVGTIGSQSSTAMNFRTQPLVAGGLGAAGGTIGAHNGGNASTPGSNGNTCQGGASGGSGGGGGGSLQAGGNGVNGQSAAATTKSAVNANRIVWMPESFNAMNTVLCGGGGTGGSGGGSGGSGSLAVGAAGGAGGGGGAGGAYVHISGNSLVLSGTATISANGVNGGNGSNGSNGSAAGSGGGGAGAGAGAGAGGLVVTRELSFSGIAVANGGIGGSPGVSGTAGDATAGNGGSATAGGNGGAGVVVAFIYT